MALRCQVQIEATRRRYGPEEQARLVDLFGEPDRWSRTLRTLLWAHASAVVPSFTGSTLVELPVPCTFDFNVAATKYFHSLEHGEVPLSLQFSGTIFYAAEDGGLQVAQIPWDKEANYRLPVVGLAGNDEHLLSQRRLVAAAQGRLRATVAVQSPARHSHLGSDDRKPAGRQPGAGAVMNARRPLAENRQSATQPAKSRRATGQCPALRRIHPLSLSGLGG